MDEFSPRQRDIRKEVPFSSLRKMKIDLTLSEILTVFTASSVHTAVPSLYDPVSVSLRALVLCELVMRHGLSTDGQRILRAEDRYTPLDEIHDEVYAKIKGAKKQKTAEKWILLLNGESYSLARDKYHIKNTRRRVVKGLVSKGILKKQKNKAKEFINFITSRGANNSLDSPATKGTKSKIAEEISAYLTGPGTYEERDILKLNILVCSFVFCGVIDDVYLTLPPSLSEVAQKKVGEIVTQYKSALGNTNKQDEWGVYCILRAYLKLATWL